MRNEKTKKLVTIAFLGAIAYLLMLLKFPLPFMPPFMDFDLAAIPELLATLLYGPLSGIGVVTVKLLIKIATVGSGSMFTGEIQNFILSSSFVLPVWFVYRKKQTNYSLSLGITAGVFFTTFVACLSNIYFIIPFYSRLYGLSMEAVIKMTQAVNPYVDSVPKLVMLGIIPFNLIKLGVNASIVVVLFKKLSVIFNRRRETHGV